MKDDFQEFIHDTLILNLLQASLAFIYKSIVLSSIYCK